MTKSDPFQTLDEMLSKAEALAKKHELDGDDENVVFLVEQAVDLERIEAGRERSASLESLAREVVESFRPTRFAETPLTAAPEPACHVDPKTGTRIVIAPDDATRAEVLDPATGLPRGLVPDGQIRR